MSITLHGVPTIGGDGGFGGLGYGDGAYGRLFGGDCRISGDGYGDGDGTGYGDGDGRGGGSSPEADE